jgi:hypothetical protein
MSIASNLHYLAGWKAQKSRADLVNHQNCCD